MDSEGETRGARAQSETIGFVLVVGFVVLGSTLVVALGAVAIGDTEERLAEERAEKALTQLDSKAALIALDESTSHDVSFGTGATNGERIVVDGDAGWMRVTVTDRANDNTTTVMNVTALGAVIYEGEESRMAYQGGGVWRSDPQGGQMVSPPEFHYRGQTLTLPAVNITGEGVIDDEATIRGIETKQHYPNINRSFLNPVENSVVNVTVGSEFYRGWGTYFSERTDGEVTFDDENETTTLTLASPVGDIFAESVIAGQVSSGNLTFQGNPGPNHPCNSNAYSDSYNSSEGGYCDHSTNETGSAGDLTFAGNISTDSSSGEVFGNLVSGDSMDLHGNADVHGDILYVEDCAVTSAGGPDCEDALADPDEYDVIETGPFQANPAIDFAIENAANEILTRGDPVTIDGGDELGAGEYYTDAIDLDGEAVTFNTSDGDINLAVNGTVSLTNGANITVEGEGDGEANVYVRASDPMQCELRIEGGNSAVYAPNNDAGKLTILGKADFTGQITDGEYTGVIYAPAGDIGNGEFGVYGQLYGAIVTGEMQVGATAGGGDVGCGAAGGAGGSIHYDETLKNQRIIPPDQTIIRLNFLHITENRITVEG